MNRLAIPFRPRYGILFRPRRIEDSPDHRIYVRKKQGPQDFVSVIPRKGVCGRVQQPVQSMLLARTSNCDAAVAASRRLF